MSHRIFSVPFADIYPHYVTKVERKDRTVNELHEVITWLTGYSEEELNRVREDRATLEEFFAQAPALIPSRSLITGSVCGYKVQDIENPLMQNIRYMDKLVDELAKGKAMEKILRA
ncbi:DUF2200 domain-containing protein [Corynebacterium sp. YSMAA1_1_D6]|uniref:DUF2200 domain-containing protein n=1 Tax=Corynebacterium sp. YSMAA1_1_D6 TaxID=3383589 RepID=UPI0038D0B690